MSSEKEKPAPAEPAADPPAAAPAAEKAEKVEKAEKAPAPEEATAATDEVSAEASAKTAGDATATDAAPAEGSTAEGDAAAVADEDDADAWVEETDAEPGAAFDVAREVVRQLHDVLTRLKAGKAEPEAAENFADVARDMQLQLLALRRAHRSMAKAADTGRAAEAQARRLADIEHAHLETRRYESACSRAAARRCRNFPAPQLTLLRPHLEDGGDVEDLADGDLADVAVADGGLARIGLAARLEAERLERLRLAGELEALEQRKGKDLEALREHERLGAELSSKLRAVEKALEPVCDLIDVRPRPQAAAVLPQGLAQLPTPLRFIFSKFDALASFGADSGVVVRLQESADGSEDAPAAKRQRTEAEGDSKFSARSAVVVEISQAGGGGQASQLRFACVDKGGAVVSVAVEGGAGDPLVENLWPEDDGRSPPLVTLANSSGACTGRPFFWAQVLAGLRDCLVTRAPALMAVDTVSALDVVTRVRARMGEKH